jgi:penicillin amidase
MDFYEVKFRDSTMKEYWFDSSWKQTEWREETIKVKGKTDFIDHVAVTVWGPVMYDAHYESKLADGKAYAIRWTAHDKSSEYRTFQLLNRAKNYNDYLEALKHFSNPAQNFAFASKRNNIALWQAGKLPAKWKYQGDFIMPGIDSSFRWQAYIPFADLVHELNPAKGFVSSANQLPADTSYPYYLGGFYDLFRGYMINRILSKPDSTLTVQDMQKMQTSTYDVFAEMALPVMIKYVDKDALTPGGKTLLQLCTSWNLNAAANENGKTVFENWWKKFKDTIYNDDMISMASESLPEPSDQTLLQGITRDSIAYKFIDNKKTAAIESLSSMLAGSLNSAAAMLSSKPVNWGEFKSTRLTHLLRIPAFNLMNLNTGGGRRIINATKDSHGPSWRMIVHLTDETEAYGVYPGGQNGNPGSKYYTQFADAWVKGTYYRLWQMKQSEMKDEKVKYTIHFSKA